jgi:hypothetical protein
MRPISQCSGLVDVVTAWGEPLDRRQLQPGQLRPVRVHRRRMADQPFRDHLLLPERIRSIISGVRPDPLLLEHPDGSN